MNTTNKVTFSVDDVELLYAIPEPGGDISTILRTFVFLNRTAPPGFPLLCNCFTKAIQAGILMKAGGHYQIFPEWYQRIHAYDETEGNEIESMLRFQDDFLGQWIDLKNTSHSDIDESEYKTIVQKLK